MEGLQWLVSCGFTNHLAVNHSLHFVDPITHMHTNNIVSCWRYLRHRLSRGGIRKDQLDSHIFEHLWHLDCNNCGADPFQELIFWYVCIMVGTTDLLLLPSYVWKMYSLCC
jgi:hypothetical protein